MTRSVPGGHPAAAPSRLSEATASPAAPDTTGFRSSGQSPGAGSARPPARVHLVGPGRVGREFLALLPELPARLVAVTDASATVFAPQGLDPAAIAAHKAGGAPLTALPRAEVVPTPLAIGLVAADVVVDATPTELAGVAAAVERVRAGLRNGAFVALCGKNALAAAAAEWFAGAFAGRVGIHAALGGAGRQLAAERAELREHCRGLCLVGNVTTTVVVQAIERGGSLADGLAEAAARGLLESDPTADLDGSDAVQKLAAVWGVLFGEADRPVDAAAIPREDLRALSPETLRERARRGATTRLVGRGHRGGGQRVAFEEVPAGSPLAAPPDRVVYGYEVPQGLRVHTGLGLGHRATAGALAEDVRAALADLAARAARGGEEVRR